MNLKLPKTSHGRFEGWRIAIFDIWEVSLDGTPIASQLFLCLFWISLWLKNRCLQHPYFKNLCKIAQASKNSDPNAQHFLSDLLTHSWFHSMLFALPCYQFPYIVMNRCLYVTSWCDTLEATPLEVGVSSCCWIHWNWLIGCLFSQKDKEKRNWKIWETSAVTYKSDACFLDGDKCERSAPNLHSLLCWKQLCISPRKEI